MNKIYILGIVACTITATCGVINESILGIVFGIVGIVVNLISIDTK